MKFKTMMTVKAAVCLVFGIPMLIVPGLLMSLFGVTLDTGGALMARLYGASLLGNLMLTWFGRNVSASDARRAIAIHLLVYDAIGLVVALLATLAGVMNGLGWFVVLIYLAIALGFGYFVFMKPRASNQPIG
jgi:hypothetical protein